MKLMTTFRDTHVSAPDGSGVSRIRKFYFSTNDSGKVVENPNLVLGLATVNSGKLLVTVEFDGNQTLSSFNTVNGLPADITTIGSSFTESIFYNDINLFAIVVETMVKIGSSGRLPISKDSSDIMERLLLRYMSRLTV